MPIDASIPYEALRGLQKAEPYDPMAFQARLQRQQGAQQGPNAAMMRYGQEQQENQEIAAIAQQYGDDYDAMGQAIIARFPHRADVVGGIQTALKDGATKHLEMTKSARAELQSRLAALQGANDDATWQPVAKGIVDDFPQLSPLFAGQPYSPELQSRIVSIGRSQDEWLDAQEKAAQSLLDGKKQEGAARLIVAADTPAKQTELQGLLAQAGWKKFLGVMPDAASAQAYLDKQAKADPEKAAKVGTFEDYVVRTYGPNPTPAQILAARKAYGQADDKAVRVSVSGGGPAGEGLSEGPGGGLESIATQYRLTKKFPPGVARTISKADVNRAINMAAQDDKLLGRSAAASIQKAAMFQANAKAAGQMAVLGAGTEAAESKALGQIDIIKELSPKVWRTSSTGINEWLVNPTQRFTGNKDAQSLANAILTFSSEYSKIINGSVGSVAGASDSARNDAAKLISNALDHGNLMQQLNLMQREMALTRVGYDVAQQHIAEQMQGPQVPGATPAAGAAPDPASLRQKYKY